MKHITILTSSWKSALLNRSASLLLACCVTTGSIAQTTLWLETFDGGASTTGFTVDNNVSDCYWTYAPDSVHPGFTFSQDFSGAWPASSGFDSSFVFLDSDECGASGIVVNSYLNSGSFDASGVGFYTLSFAHQFRARLQSFIHVDAWNGTAWTQVYHNTGTDIGYPNPATVTSVDITTGTGGSQEAKVRFQFSSGWDWWWALDSISVIYTSTAGIHGLDARTLRVFPNPAQDVLYVKDQPVEVVRLRVFDATGQKVLEQGMSRQITINSLATGVYTLVGVDNNGAEMVRTRFAKE